MDKPHIVKTCWGWAIYYSKHHSMYGLPIVIGTSVNGAIAKYVIYMCDA